MSDFGGVSPRSSIHTCCIVRVFIAHVQGCWTKEWMYWWRGGAWVFVGACTRLNTCRSPQSVEGFQNQPTLPEALRSTPCSALELLLLYLHTRFIHCSDFWTQWNPLHGKQWLHANWQCVMETSSSVNSLMAEQRQMVHDRHMKGLWASLSWMNTSDLMPASVSQCHFLITILNVLVIFPWRVAQLEAHEETHASTTDDGLQAGVQFCCFWFHA